MDITQFTYTVLPNASRVPSSGNFEAFLWEDNWDDWFRYSTMYRLTIFAEDGSRHEIGEVKIGQFGMQDQQRRPAIPTSFSMLDDSFFSLGQDDTYYENLNKLDDRLRSHILTSIRDCAADARLFERALPEHVTRVSLLRSVTATTVRGQFRRMTTGGARLSPFHFTYQMARPTRAAEPPISVEFSVKPESQPPTNIHVLIGRNGVGKTFIMNRMTRALVEPQTAQQDIGVFAPIDAAGGDALFAGLVSVSFSAFDDLKPISAEAIKQSPVRYTYIGLKSVDAAGSFTGTKTPDMLGEDFVESLRACSQGAKRSRWIRALQLLESDPIFKDADVVGLLGVGDWSPSGAAKNIYSLLSSGHKIVLLTMTKLVELVEERTLVLIDEPEAHLHPPLLSAFVRALSDLLVNRNGVAIVATHSPVVLQEVPRICAWKLRRTGSELNAERPEIETFGENVGILTREVFGLEVTQSGFHKLLESSIQQQQTFDAVVQSFGGELGAEARAIAQAIIAARKNNNP